MASGRETPQPCSEEHARPLVVAADRLAVQIASVLRAWGMPDDHVTVTVDRILYADLRGIDSHGCTTLAFYQRLRADGVLNPRAKVAVTRHEGATTLVDGGGGLGHVPATRAMELAIEIAAVHGVGAVAVCNSGHFGAAGAYAAMAADKGLIGIATTSTPTPTVVPTFGRQAMLGTNPIAFAAPARRHPMFLLDMATSTASFGKVLEQWRKGRTIPDRWMLDQDGAPLTAGHAALTNQRLTPLGGDLDGASYKGYGLAMMVEILSAALAGLTFADPRLGRRPRVGHFVMALDPARFSTCRRLHGPRRCADRRDARDRPGRSRPPGPGARRSRAGHAGRAPRQRHSPHAQRRRGPARGGSCLRGAVPARSGMRRRRRPRSNSTNLS